MAEKSNIEWTDATWNIARGCTKVDEDCKFCYMYRESLNGTRYEPKIVTRTKTVFDLPLRIKEPSKIFASSLTDWGHEDIDYYRHEFYDIIKRCPQHTFQCPTKRTERLPKILPIDWGDGYPNVWLGTSVGSQNSVHRITELIRIPARIRFLSLEPLHGEIDISPYLWMPTNYCKYCGTGGFFLKQPCDNMCSFKPIQWVIVGGESGNETGLYRYRPCKLEWIEKVVSDCKAAGVPVFVKQLGTHLAKELKLKDRHGKKMEEWPEHLRIREFPV